MQWVSYNCCATKITLMQCLQTCPSETFIAFIFFYTAIQLYTDISLRPLYNWRRRKMISCKNQHFPSKKQWTLVKHNLLMGTQSMYTKRDIPLPLPGSAAEGLQML